MIDHEFRVIFRTGRSHEILMALNELKAAGIPAFGQEETVSGLITAMPTTPTPGPGTFWSIRVPEHAHNDAMKILESLPIEITMNPDIMHFNSDPTVGKWLRIGAIATLVIFFCRSSIWLLIGFNTLLTKPSKCTYYVYTLNIKCTHRK